MRKLIEMEDLKPSGEKMMRLEEIYSAALDGDAVAQCKLGFEYLRGTHVSRNICESFKWCKDSSDQGYAVAQFAVGWFYYKGMAVQRDYSMAEHYYQKAAKQGYPEAQLNLALLLCKLGGENNCITAVSWLQKAAVQGIINAQATLGLHHITGCGTKKNFALGCAWLSIAAHNGLSSWKHLLILWLVRLWLSNEQRKEIQVLIENGKSPPL